MTAAGNGNYEPGTATVTVTVTEKDTQPETDDGVTFFVKRCYKQILDRDADEGGLQGWSDALESGAGQACQIIDGFVRSEEYVNRNLDNGASVDILYMTMLNRDADPEGRAGWVDALGQGYTLQHIINGFCGSAEFQEKLPGNEEFIRILYLLYFDREPGTVELSGWVQMLEGGATLDEIVNGFASSAEFKAIVNNMKN